MIFRYKWHTGSAAWLVHRITGVLLTLYIFFHLYVLLSLKDPASFETFRGLMRSPLFRLGELGLFALVASHALNGLRVTLLEWGMSTKLQKPAFWLAVAGLAALLVYGLSAFTGGGA